MLVSSLHGERTCPSNAPFFFLLLLLMPRLDKGRFVVLFFRFSLVTVVISAIYCQRCIRVFTTWRKMLGSLNCSFIIFVKLIRQTMKDVVITSVFIDTMHNALLCSELSARSSVLCSELSARSSSSWDAFPLWQSLQEACLYRQKLGRLYYPLFLLRVLCWSV